MKDYEYYYDEAVMEIGSSSDSSEDFNENIEVEVEIEYPQKEQKNMKLNSECITQFKSSARQPETTKHSLATSHQITKKL